jgi:hypothetical protein
MTISLAFPAPDLVKAAIDGRLPHGNVLVSFRFSIDVLLKSNCSCGAENTVSNVSVTNEIVAGRRLFPLDK